MSFRSAIACWLLLGVSAFAQTTPQPAFEVASVKPAAPLDMQKIMAITQSGGKLPIGARVDGARAEYIYVSLTQLVASAYKVKNYQITGPDWLPTTYFDIIAKLPEGASKDDVPAMLQALLAERFKLSVRRETKEQPVLALVVGKAPLKLKEAEAAQPFDEDAPLKPGEVAVDTGEGPARMTIDRKTGETRVDSGKNGKFLYRVDPTTMMLHLEASQMTMAGFADILTSFSQGAGSAARKVVDQTDLKGNYQLTFDFSLAELLATMRAQGVEIPGGASDGVPKGASAASEPGGGASLSNAVQALGLKLEPRKRPVEQLIIDHVEKTPVEN